MKEGTFSKLVTREHRTGARSVFLAIGRRDDRIRLSNKNRGVDRGDHPIPPVRVTRAIGRAEQQTCRQGKEGTRA